MADELVVIESIGGALKFNRHAMTSEFTGLCEVAEPELAIVILTPSEYLQVDCRECTARLDA